MKKNQHLKRVDKLRVSIQTLIYQQIILEFHNFRIQKLSGNIQVNLMEEHRIHLFQIIIIILRFQVMGWIA